MSTSAFSKIKLRNAMPSTHVRYYHEKLNNHPLKLTVEYDLSITIILTKHQVESYEKFVDTVANVTSVQN